MTEQSPLQYVAGTDDTDKVVPISKARAARPSFHVSRVTGQSDKTPTHEKRMLRELLELFSAPHIRSDKDGAGVTLGRFDQEAWEKDPRPTKRKDQEGKPTGWLAGEYCLRSSGYLGDIDNKARDKTMVPKPITFDAAKKVLDQLGVAYALHTTHSSCAKWPRLRFVVPFEQDLGGPPEEIKAKYKAVHDHLDALFGGALDSRSSPAFFAYLPSTSKESRFEGAVQADRPLFDPHGIKPSHQKAVPRPEAYEFYEKEQLPGIDLSKFRLGPELRAKLEYPLTGNRSDKLPAIYHGLRKAGMTPAQIAATVWVSKGTSEAVREEKRGYQWLCEDVRRILNERSQDLLARDQALFARYIYVEQQKQYYDRVSQTTLDKDGLNDRLIKEYGDDRTHSAHKFFQAHWEQRGGKRVHTYTYIPGRARITRFAGHLCLNLWTPAVLDMPEEASDKDVRPWLNLVKRLVPDLKYREHLFDWMAYGVQNPGVKINHHPLLCGKPGSGKDTIVEPFFFAIGGGLPGSRGESPKDRTNISYIANETLNKDWGYHMQSQVCCVQELREGYIGERRQLANTLKPFMAAPPPSIRINTKYTHPFDIPNTVLWVFFSNWADPITLEDDDRRFFAIWTHAPAMGEKEADDIWKWYRKGGLKLCARWLHDRDVTAFNPKANAPITPFHEALADAGKTDIESGLQSLIDARKPPFDVDLVSPSHAAAALNDLIKASQAYLSTTTAPGDLRKTVTGPQIGAALTARQWRHLPRLNLTRDGERITTTLYAHPSVAEKYRKMGGTEVYDAWNAPKRRAKKSDRKDFT